ncbi:type IA DNA topoisomerase [Halodesulfovibrio sp.]|jgi:DNA topoisomerase-3|uniref:type IA DNA topoisomerase n=1 Tax=Halodesulfovibrio sp. TaxID=1912772 RepID=UPI0025F370C1|nr:type IA DNA topoisomerase [Halodesulfovibrio sp.]MCT4625784.1 DNA topoisomerase 3 [Halodesulfovibrio sp.]
MPKTLIIAEKPSVAREIAPHVNATNRREGYLEGTTHIVSWAVGHLVGIAEPEEQHEAWQGRWNIQQLPIIPPKFKLAVLKEGQRQYAVLNRLLNDQNVSDIVNATDAGREGELIFRRIYLMAGCDKPVQRLWANDMTEEGLKKSLRSLMPDAKKRNLGLAAFARAEADWLIGMNFSRLFTVKANRLISVGRVQTPVLKLLSDRRSEIEDFTPKDYWTVEATFCRPEKAASSKKTAEEDANELSTANCFSATYHLPEDEKETRINFESRAHKVADECKNKEGKVEGVTSRKGTTKPPLPFDLTTLQREANTRFGLSAKDTLAIAQALYEQKKLITYPRTDSRHLTKELFAEILTYFRAIYPLYKDETVPAVDRIKDGKKFLCVNDKKVTDHHAIIPTARKANMLQLSGDEQKIYDMICRRFIAAFSQEAIYQSSTVRVFVGEHLFIAKGKVFKDKGWLVVEPWRTAKDNPLPSLRKGTTVHTESIDTVTRQTKAPAHFTDASLLSAMETAGKFVEDDELRLAMKERGLGTPATRAQVIETLLSRKYIERKGKKIQATNSGQEVIEVISAMLPDIVSPEMTGQWEKKLKDIEGGKATYPEFMHSIRHLVAGGIHHIKDKSVAPILLARKAKEVGEREPDGKCPLCGGEILDMDKRYACSNWKRDDGGCMFVIWKTMFGRTLEKSIVDELLHAGRTAEPLDLVSKAGKEYSAHLKIELGQVKLEFANSPRPQSQWSGSTSQDAIPYDIAPEDMPPPAPLPHELESSSTQPAPSIVIEPAQPSDSADNNTNK